MSLELEFEEIKKQHMLKTCFCYALTEVEEEVTSKVNLPLFMLKDSILKEAKDRVIFNYNAGEEVFKKYYDKAYYTLLDMTCQ